MQAIERINLPKPDTHCFDDDTKSDVWSYSRELVIRTVLAHIDKLRAEIHASDLAVAEYRQQCIDNAQEIARLRAESEERLQNCVALGAENEQLRKDAERYRFLKAQRIDGEPGIPVIAVPNGMRSGYYMNEENADYAVDTAMKGTP